MAAAVGVVIGAVGSAAAAAVPAAGIFGLPAVVAQAGIGLVTAGVQYGASQLLSQGDSNSGSISRTVGSLPKLGTRFVALGRLRTGGHIVHRDVADATGDLWQVVVVSYGRISEYVRHFIDGEQVTLDGSGIVTSPSKWAGKIQIYMRTGTTGQTAVTAMTSALSYMDPADHIGKGVAYAVIRQSPVASGAYDATYPNGPVQYSADIRGALLPQVNGSAAAFSNDAARAVLWHLTDSDAGYGIPLADIDVPSFQIHSAHCREDVALNAGGTENRYEAAGYVDFSRRRIDVLRDLLLNCDADLRINERGEIEIVKYKQPATLSLTDSNVVSYNLQAGSTREQQVDAVVGVYADAANEYIETTTPPRRLGATAVNTATAQFPFCTSGTQAQRLTKKVLLRENPIAQGEASMHMAGLSVLPGAAVTMDTTTNLVDEDLRVDARSVQMPTAGGDTSPVVTLTLAALSDDYDLWDPAADELDTSSPPAVNGTGDILSAPTIGSATLVEQVLAGASASVIEVAHSTESADVLTEIEWSVADADEWLGPIRRAASVGTIRTGVLEEGVTYDVRVRFVLRDGLSATDWTVEEDVTATQDSAAPSSATITATTGSGDGEVNVSVTSPSNTNYRRCEIRFSGGAGDDYAGATFDQYVLINQPGTTYNFTFTGVSATLYRIYAEAQNTSGVGATVVSDTATSGNAP